MICLGDFNATSSAFWFNSSLRENIVIENLVINDNGERFHNLVNVNALSVLNTWFTHKECRRITWHSPDGKTKKVYDFILACSWLRQYVRNCRVYNSFDFDSDHRLVIATLITPTSKVSRYVKRSAKRKKKLDLRYLRDPTVKTNFIDSVVGKITSSNILNSDLNNSEVNKQFVDAINTAAEESLPKVENTRVIHPWHNDEKLTQLYARKDELISQNADHKALSNIRRKIRMRASHLRNEYFKTEAAKINHLAVNRELDKLYQEAKIQDTTLKPVKSFCPPDQLLKHFKSHFNPDDPSEHSTPVEFTSDNLPKFIHQLRDISQGFTINDQPPEIEEIRKKIADMKSKKASNDIDPELLKHCEHPIMLQVIHRMTTKLWENLDFPNAWGNSRLNTIWKGKGSKKDPSKYRGLSIGSTVCKLIMSIIIDRLRPWYERQLTDEQNGFRQNRGTTDSIYTLKRVHQITHKKKQPLFLLFVDLTAAFDHIPRKWLFESIRLRFPDRMNIKLLQILETLYSDTSLTFEETTFKTSSGVRQGGPESPFLFTLYADFVMRVFLELCSNHDDIKFFIHKYRIHPRSVLREERSCMRFQGVRLWGDDTISWSGYADDLILFLLDNVSLQKAAVLLDQVFLRFGLTINKLKTETMILNCCDDPYPETVIQLGTTALKNVESFKYLGAMVNFDEPNTGDIELNYRIQAAKAKFAQLANLLQNNGILLRTRVKFLDSFVRSRLTYSCQNWNINDKQLDRLDVCYRFFLRRMIRGGFKRQNEEAADFRYKLSNEDVHAICGSKDVSVFIKDQQKNYAAHVVRMSVDRVLKKLMFNDDRCVRPGRIAKTLLQQVTDYGNVTTDSFCNDALRKKAQKST